jgi:predicted Rossmann-fold nucleotide-binding protein
LTGETVDVHEVFMAFVCFPGGLGSLNELNELNELFESLTLIQTKKIQTFPIILVDSVFWKEFIDWI